MKFLTRDKNFYSDTLKIALPISMQFLLANLLNMLDTIMVGGLGEKPLAGVMAGNNIFLVYTFFTIGITSGAGIFSAQYFGSKNFDGIRRVMGMALVLSCIVAAAFMVVIFLVPQKITYIFTTDPEVANYAKDFILILLISLIPTAISECYFAVLKSTAQVKIPLIVSIIALSLNTVLNYLLIYGKFGFPKLGVSGTAIATVISRVVQVVLMIILVFWDKHIIACRLREFAFNKNMLFAFAKVSAPVIANESLWGLGYTTYNIVYGRMGTIAIAVSAIVSNVERIFTFCFMGVGYAALALIGKKIGEKREDLAYDYAISYIWLTGLIGLFIGALVITTSKFVLNFYDVSQITLKTASQVLMVLSMLIFIRAINFVNIVGILRSGGDTVTTAVIDLTSIWFVGVPLAILGGIILHLPMPIVFLMLSGEEVFKFIAGLKRLLSKKWIRSLA